MDERLRNIMQELAEDEEAAKKRRFFQVKSDLSIPLDKNNPSSNTQMDQGILAMGAAGHTIDRSLVTINSDTQSMVHSVWVEDQLGGHLVHQETFVYTGKDGNSRSGRILDPINRRDAERIQAHEATQQPNNGEEWSFYIDY